MLPTLEPVLNMKFSIIKLWLFGIYILLQRLHLCLITFSTIPSLHAPVILNNCSLIILCLSITNSILVSICGRRKLHNIERQCFRHSEHTLLAHFMNKEQPFHSLIEQIIKQPVRPHESNNRECLVYIHINTYGKMTNAFFYNLVSCNTVTSGYNILFNKCGKGLEQEKNKSLHPQSKF